MSPLNKCYRLLERIFKAKERHLPLFHMGQEKRSEGGGGEGLQFRRVFRNQSKIYNGAFFAKIVNG